MGVRKLAEWMGLVEDGRYSDPKDELSEEYSVDEYVEPDPEPKPAASPKPVARIHRRPHAVRPEPAAAAAPAPSPAPAPAPAPVPSPAPEPRQVTDLSRIIYVRPRSYNEARSIGENYRDGIPVIMNLSDMERGEDKRLVDFAAGLIFGLRGNIERISSQVFLLCPHNLVVGPEDKQKLATGGFFNQS